jgi:anti-anti-sigma factor
MTFSGPTPASGPLPGLTLSAFSEAAVTVIALRGEADVATLPALIDMLARVSAEEDGPVVVDLADTGFVDTATVRTLVRARQFLGEHGRQLTFRAPSRQAARLLVFAGLSDLITPRPSMDLDRGRPPPSNGGGQLIGDQVRADRGRAAHPSSPLPC